MKSKPGKLILVVGIFTLICALLPYVWMMIFYKSAEMDDIIALLLISLFFGILSAFLLLHYRNYRIEIDDNSIYLTNMFGNKKVMNLSEVIEVDYNKNLKFIVLRTANNSLKVDSIYVDILHFFDRNKFSEKLMDVLEEE